MKHLNIVLAFVILFILGSYICTHAQQQSVTNTLTFVDNSINEDGFKIERSINKSQFVQVTTLLPNVVQYTETLPTPLSAMEFCYRVRAYNSAGDSEYSNIACKTSPVIVMIPSSPSGLIVIIK